MQLESTRNVERTATLIVRPELISAARRMLEMERICRESDTDPATPAYRASIQYLINDVHEGRPIELGAYMSPEERLIAIEEGWSDFGSVGGYLRGTIQYAFERDLTGTTAEDWRYLSDLAALGADIEAATVAQV